MDDDDQAPEHPPAEEELPHHPPERDGADDGGGIQPADVDSSEGEGDAGNEEEEEEIADERVRQVLALLLGRGNAFFMRPNYRTHEEIAARLFSVDEADAVRRALETVPRGWFVPEALRAAAYHDAPLELPELHTYGRLLFFFML